MLNECDLRINLVVKSLMSRSITVPVHLHKIINALVLEASKSVQVDFKPGFAESSSQP